MNVSEEIKKLQDKIDILRTNTGLFEIEYRWQTIYNNKRILLGIIKNFPIPFTCEIGIVGCNCGRYFSSVNTRADFLRMADADLLDRADAGLLRQYGYTKKSYWHDRMYNGPYYKTEREAEEALEKEIGITMSFPDVP